MHSEKWGYFKLYKKSQSDCSWKSILDWYHESLRIIVSPFIDASKEVEAVLFSLYGPQQYDVEDGDRYERVITPPDSDVVFIRLRMYVGQNDKKAVNKRLQESINSRRNIIWDYELLNKYNARQDLGGRYGRLIDGSIDDERTIRFIRYWDSGCRYILSIISDSGNWDKNVDVWGVPHLINNALGGWLRPTNVKCPNCKELMYMATYVTRLPEAVSIIGVPSFLFACPRCNRQLVVPTNI